jgi:hypothetical protein
MERTIIDAICSPLYPRQRNRLLIHSREVRVGDFVNHARRDIGSFTDDMYNWGAGEYVSYNV